MNEYAYRGFVTKDGKVVAWPTLLADHNQFKHIFYVSDEDVMARWRQWSANDPVSYDPGTPNEARIIVEEWLKNQA